MPLAPTSLPLPGLYRICYSLVGGDGTYGDVLPPAAYAASTDRYLLNVTQGQLAIQVDPLTTLYQRVVNQSVVLSYNLNASGNVARAPCPPRRHFCSFFLKFLK